jgi:DNA-binding winged helix-turn-helix (wHTH) protein
LSTDTQTRTFQFGAFELDRFSGELRKNGVRIKLQGQPFQILNLLLDRRGELVTRDDIRHCLWPDNTIVDFDNAISSAVWKIREALGDNSENPRFVQTMSRRGYRFVMPVSVRDRVAGVEVARREELSNATNGTAQDQIEEAHAQSSADAVTEAGGPNGFNHPISSSNNELTEEPRGVSPNGQACRRTEKSTGSKDEPRSGWQSRSYCRSAAYISS